MSVLELYLSVAVRDPNNSLDLHVDNIALDVTTVRSSLTIL